MLFLIAFGHFYFFAQAQYRFDMVIYGATPGGIAAAIQTARMVKVSCFDRAITAYYIGGHITGGLGSADIDNHKEFRNSSVIGGIAVQEVSYPVLKKQLIRDKLIIHLPM